MPDIKGFEINGVRMTLHDEEYERDMESLREDMQQLREDADTGKFRGERGERGFPGAKGEPGPRGEPGHTPVAGEDYYTEEDKAALVEQIKDEGQSDIQKNTEAISRLTDAVAELQRNPASGIICEASGAEIELRDSAEAPIRGLTIYGKSEQVVTTGKNLLDYSARTVSGGNIRFQPIDLHAGTYTFSVETSIELTNLYCRRRGEEDLIFKIYGKNEHTFTVDDGTYEFWIYSSTYTSIDDCYSAQVELGNAATAYEPYTGGKPSPSPDYPQPIEVADEPVVTVSGKDGEPQSVKIPHTLRAVGDVRDELEVYSDGTGRLTKRCLVWYDDGSPWIGEYFPTMIKNTTYPFKSGIRLNCNYFNNVMNSNRLDSAFAQIITDGKFDSVDAFNAFAAAAYKSGNPITTVLPLVTPIVTDLTAEEVQDILALRTCQHYTHVSNDKGAGMSITYVADTKDYIDRKFEEISEAIVASKE